MLTLHHLENSQSIRVLWLLEELGAEYEFKMYDRDPVSQLAPAEYKAISPLGTAPVITDGDLVMSETSAIMDYIMDKFGDGGLRPAIGTQERTKYLYWFHVAQGSLQPILTNIYVFSAMVARSPFFIRPVVKLISNTLNEVMIIPRRDALYAEIEKALGESTWFAGEALTAADIVMGYSMEVAEVRGELTADKYPNAHRFLKQMRELPAYQRALEIDGKFNPLPPAG